MIMDGAIASGARRWILTDAALCADDHHRQQEPEKENSAKPG
jgi:hypothetical protein